jgi:salicylate hydroxylase
MANPHMVGHRPLLAGSLFQACNEEKAITSFFSTTIEERISFSSRPSLRAKSRNGDSFTVEADVLLTADDVKRIVRPGMLKELGVDADSVDAGQSAYRIMLWRE